MKQIYKEILSNIKKDDAKKLIPVMYKHIEDVAKQQYDLISSAEDVYDLDFNKLKGLSNNMSNAFDMLHSIEEYIGD